MCISDFKTVLYRKKDNFISAELQNTRKANTLEEFSEQTQTIAK